MGTLARLTEQELWAIAEALAALPNPALWRLDESSMPGQHYPCIVPASALLLAVLLLLLPHMQYSGVMHVCQICCMPSVAMRLLVLLLQLQCDSGAMHGCQTCCSCMPSAAVLLLVLLLELQCDSRSTA